MAFKHPKCGGQHETVADARSCETGVLIAEREEQYQRQMASLWDGERAASAIRQHAVATRYGYGNPERESRRATEKQVKFVKSLATYREMTEASAQEALQRVEADEKARRGEAGGRLMSFQYARQFIEGYKDATNKVERRQSATVVTEDGMYRNPESGAIFKVQYNRASGSGRHLYAKALVVEVEPERDETGAITKPAQIRFDYIGARPLHDGTIKPEWQMTLQQAREFGPLYGTCIYGHPLTDEKSIAKGIGPVCEKKFH